MQAIVDKNACIGCGVCPSVCPEVFKLDDDGLASAYVTPVPAEFEDMADEAADSCPVNAIRIER